MRLICYSIFDSAVGAYMRPMFMQSDGQALRMFIDEVERPESEIGRHPEDFALFRIGAFDDNEGELAGEDPFCVGRAHELLAKSNVTDINGGRDAT